jgi:hypothetical protein
MVLWVESRLLLLSGGIHWLPQMVLWVESRLLVLSGGIHWLPQMVLWDERCWRSTDLKTLQLEFSHTLDRG